MQNNLTALAVSGAVLVVALISASPLPESAPAAPRMAGHADAAAALLAALERSGTQMDAAFDAGVEDAPTTRRGGGADAPTHRRIAMPYFTFLPRG